MIGFDDMEEDLIVGAPTDLKSLPKKKPDQKQVWVETCGKCGGSGRYIGPSSLGHNHCTLCKGKGTCEYKSSPEDRRKARESNARLEAKKQLAVRAKAEQFEIDNPDIKNWWTDSNFQLAIDLKNDLYRYGSLTVKQIELAKRCVARLEETKREQIRKANEAPAITTSRIELAFNTARSNGIKRPRLRLGEFLFSMAPDNGRNAGALYVVREESDTYLGKCLAGKFQASRDCDDATTNHILAAAADPKAAAQAHGMRTGSCSVCSRPLTKGESIDLGIGPICAGRFGW